MGFWDWFWLVYFIGLIPSWLVMSRFMLGIFMEDSYRKKPNADDKFGAIGLGFVMMWCWPMGIPFAGIWKALESDD